MVVYAGRGGREGGRVGGLFCTISPRKPRDSDPRAGTAEGRGDFEEPTAA